MKFYPAADIQTRIEKIVSRADMGHINTSRIICMRSTGSKARAYARIWSLPRIWQEALGIEAHYVIEVISERFDKLKTEAQDRTLIHELLHIPKTFSGALVPHRCFEKRIDEKAVEKIYKIFRGCQT